MGTVRQGFLHDHRGECGRSRNGVQLQVMVRMLDAWIGCKDAIGEADIWYTLMTFGGFDTKAEYLGGQDWKAFWVDLISNRLPWDDIEMFVERTMANLCQRNTDAQGQA